LKYEYNLEFSVTEHELTVSCKSAHSSTIVDWVLMLDDLKVRLKEKFAEQIITHCELKNGLSEKEKRAVISELDKLEAPHPNQATHDEILNQAILNLVTKLELKQNMEHLN